MSKFVVISPYNELLRYGPDLIKKQVADIHARGKMAKFVFGVGYLKDPNTPPTLGNLNFSPNQIEAPDIVIFIDKDGKQVYLKGSETCL